LYPGSSTQWLHKLDIEMYGEDKFWVIVERTSGSAAPQEPPLNAMSTEQLHDRANTLQKQIEHAETQQRERQKERESAGDRDRGRGRGGNSSRGEPVEEAEDEAAGRQRYRKRKQGQVNLCVQDAKSG
jgi:hypothetical protein